MLHFFIGMLQEPAVLELGSGLAVIGGALAVVGGGLGIGRIGAAMAEGIARQPEAYGNIQTASIILAALIEGVTLFALVIALIK